MYRTPPKYRRLEHLLENNVPTQTEIRSYLGPSLAQIFQDHSDETTRKLIGVIPPLKGPALTDLWVSPSDQLIGKIVLKPPLTSERTKACTHQGILEIGKRAALQFERDTEESIREKLEQESVEKRKMFEAEKRRAIEIAVGEISKNYEERIECLEEKFKKQLKKALEDAADKSKKEMQKAVIQERLDVEMRMMKKLREEIGRVVVSLHDEFQECFRAQRDNLVANFNAMMRQERRKVDETIDRYEQKRNEEISVQQREFDIQKIANAAFIVCTERMRCDSETRTMRHNYEGQIKKLQKLLLELREEVATKVKTDVETLKESNDERDMFHLVEIVDKNGQSWRPIQLEPEYFRGVIQFCKDNKSSMYVAWSSVETESDESLMINERSSECIVVPALIIILAITKSYRYRLLSKIKEITNFGRNIPQALQLFKSWQSKIPQIGCSPRGSNAPMVLSAINNFPADGYTDRSASHHSSTKSLLSQDSLPFCYFRDKLYVRSDYREKHERQERIEEQKTIEELAEDASFIMKLGRSCSRTDSLANSY